ncbi:MAG: efflux RND transporter periplasmic adaptor subunit [Bacteroidota bacterium]|nr:efflux RND transporter periplasmic adaptor subunit [Bacteroidota bacterium]
MRTPLILLLCCGFLSACTDPGNSPAAETEPPPMEAKHVETLEVLPILFDDFIDLTGTIEANHDVVVSARTAGTLEMIAPLGQTVRAEQTVARVDDELLETAYRQAEAQVSNARAALRIAQDSYDRQQPLFADSIISALEFTRLETTLDQAKSSLSMAEAVYDQAARQLANTILPAPITATVEERYVEPGEQVVGGTQLLRLVDSRSVQVVAGISERYAGEIEIGTLARISPRSAGAPARTGRVSFAGSVIDPASRSFEIKIAVDNSDGKLKPEMIVQLAIVRLTIEDALVIPGNAITRNETGLAIFVVEEREGGSFARRRNVAIGPEYANRVVVTSGLSTGETVVIRGQSTLGDGDRIITDQHYEALDDFGVPILNAHPDSTTDL